MRARKEERNQAMWLEWKNGAGYKRLADKYGLCKARAKIIVTKQERFNMEKYGGGDGE